jgi:hypothetical protein
MLSGTLARDDFIPLPFLSVEAHSMPENSRTTTPDGKTDNQDCRQDPRELLQESSE